MEISIRADHKNKNIKRLKNKDLYLIPKDQPSWNKVNFYLKPILLHHPDLRMPQTTLF